MNKDGFEFFLSSLLVIRVGGGGFKCCYISQKFVYHDINVVRLSLY